MLDRDLYGNLLESSKKAEPIPVPVKGEQRLSPEQKYEQSILNINKAYESQQKLAQIKRQRQEEFAQKEAQAD